MSKTLRPFFLVNNNDAKYISSVTFLNIIKYFEDLNLGKNVFKSKI